MNMNTNATHPIPLTDAIVARGQRAWGTIKKTAAEQRELWRQVGEALLVGKTKTNRHPGESFHDWATRMGFDMSEETRQAAMWFAKTVVTTEIPDGLTHPKNIRVWFNEQPKEPLPADLQEVSIETKTVPTVDQKTAEKVAKLARRAESQDEGSEIAKRHLEAVAKKHEVSVEALKEAAATVAPATFYQFSPQQIELIEEIEGNVMATVDEMELAGLSREAIAKVFIRVAKQIMEN